MSGTSQALRLTFRGSGVPVANWGAGPLPVRKAVADFTLALPPDGRKLCALDYAGRRRKELPLNWSGTAENHSRERFLFCLI